MSEQTQVAATDEAEKPGTQVVEISRPAYKPPLVAGRPAMAIVPQDIEQAYRLASAICAADMAPKSYKRDANAVMVGILHGLEVGFTPMAALQSIAVINGMPSIWGDGALALIEASGLLEDKIERIDVDKDGNMTAVCRMKRKGRSWTEQTFSWQDAQIAKLTQKDTYKLYGRRMLQRRARAWCMTDGFADVLRGLHIREAVDDGALMQAASGVYVAETLTSTAAPARPTRGGQVADKEAQERARKAALAHEKQYRDTMAEGAGQGDGHDPVTGEVHEDPQPESTRADQPEADGEEPDDAEDATVAEEGHDESAPETATKPTAAADHNAVDSLIRRKVASYKTLTMIDAMKRDYSDDLALMKSEDRPRWDALKAVVDARVAEIAKK